jgi:DNA-binding IscR family transcriptional regulator
MIREMSDTTTQDKNLEILVECRKTLHQTEDIGSHILINLSMQHERLDNIKNNTKDINEEQKVSMTFLHRLMKWLIQ